MRRGLHQGLPGALHDAAMHLPMQNERVDGAAGVVDREVARERDLAGVGIDLDLADRAAGRIGRDAAEEILLAGERLAQIARERGLVLRRARDVEDIEPAIGLRRMEEAVVEEDVGGWDAG